MYKLTKHYTESLTPHRAKAFAAKNNYPGQRKKDPKRTEKIIDLIQGGAFRVANVAIAHQNGYTCVVNGQHSCDAVEKTGIAVPCLIEEYTCEDENDIALLYSTYDTDLSLRSQSDVNVPYAHLAGLEDLNQACIDYCSQVLPLFVTQVGRKFSKRDKAELLVRYPNHCRFLNKVLFEGKPRCRHLKSRSIIGACILRCWARDHEAATQFWVDVRDGQLIERGQPQYALREKLFALMAKKGAQNWEYWDSCGHGWNAYREGKSLKLIRCYETSEWVDFI